MKTRSAAIFLVTLSFWLVHCAVFTLSNALENNPQIRDLALARVGVSVVGIAFCYAILLVLRRLPTRRLSLKVATLAILSPVSGEIFAWIAYFAFQIATGQEISFEIKWGSALVVLSMYSWLFFAWGALVLSIEYSFNLREEERRNAEFRSLAKDAKLRALQAQINPHFLFNSLNSLSALILDGRNQDAENMVSRLANFLRFTLSANTLNDIPLAEEIRHQKEYLAIEQVRDPDLRVMFDAPERVMPAKVPALLLQPLVENAVKHGAIAPAEPWDILISADQITDRLVIEITNEIRPVGAQPKPIGAGMGVSYVRERLANRFGDRQSFSAECAADGKYRVTLSIPFSYDDILPTPHCR